MKNSFWPQFKIVSLLGKYVILNAVKRSPTEGLQPILSPPFNKSNYELISNEYKTDVFVKTISCDVSEKNRNHFCLVESPSVEANPRMLSI